MRRSTLPASPFRGFRLTAATAGCPGGLSRLSGAAA